MKKTNNDLNCKITVMGNSPQSTAIIEHLPCAIIPVTWVSRVNASAICQYMWNVRLILIHPINDDTHIRIWVLFSFLAMLSILFTFFPILLILPIDMDKVYLTSLTVWIIPLQWYVLCQDFSQPSPYSSIQCSFPALFFCCAHITLWELSFL